MSNNRRLEKEHFDIYGVGFGCYRVHYTSIVTKQRWVALIENTHMVDRVKHEIKPTQKDMHELKLEVKRISNLNN